MVMKELTFLLWAGCGCGAREIDAGVVFQGCGAKNDKNGTWRSDSALQHLVQMGHTSWYLTCKMSSLVVDSTNLPFTAK